MAKTVPLSLQITRLFALVGIIILLLMLAATIYWDSRAVKLQFRTVMVNDVRSARALLKHYLESHRGKIESLIPASSGGASAESFRQQFSAFDPGDHFLLLNRDGKVILTADRHPHFLGLDFSHLPYVEDPVEVSNIHSSLFDQKPVVAFTFELPGERLLVVEEKLEEALAQIAHIDQALEGESSCLSSPGTARWSIILILTSQGAALIWVSPFRVCRHQTRSVCRSSPWKE